MSDTNRYELYKHIVGVSKFILDVLILVFLLTSGWSARIRTFSAAVADSEWLTVIVYMIIVGAAMKLVDLPFSFYSGYVLEHRFALSRQTLGGWTKDQLKGLAVAVPLSLVAIEFIYFLLRARPDIWWIYASVAFTVFIVLLANLAPVLLLPLFFKFKPVDNADLRYRVDRLAGRTGTRVCGIFEWSLGDKTRKANAAVVGWGNTRRIIVSDTLLENFSGEEIEVIMAHELCHHVKNHIWFGMAFQSVLTFVAFYVAHRVFLPLSRYFDLNGISDIATFPLLALVMTVVSLVVLPAVNYFSRRLETAADLYALDVTGDALAFVSSMEKLADLNLSNKTPNKLIEFIFYSHPSVEDRIKLAADRVGQNV